jgi:hypothetical protein
MMQLLQEQLMAISPVMVAEKIGSETLLLKLCKWLMMPVALCTHSKTR